MNNATKDIFVHVFDERRHLFLSDIYPGIDVMGFVHIIFRFSRCIKLLLKWLYHLKFPSVMDVFLLLHIRFCFASHFVHHFNYFHSCGCLVISNVIFICISLMTNWAPFLVFIGHSISVRCLCRSFAHKCSEFDPFISYMGCEYLSHSLSWNFSYRLNGIFWWTNMFNKIHIRIFFILKTFCVQFKTINLPRSKSYSPCYLLEVFILNL